MKKYVFFLDIDGTLLNNNIICRKNRQAISYARKLGHLVFINTARSSFIIPQKVRSLKFDGFVTSMGCNIICAGKQIYGVSFSVTEAAEIFDYFNKSGRIVHVEGEDVSISNEAETDLFPVKISSGAELIKRYPDRHIPKFFVPHILTAEEQKKLSKKYTFYQHKNYAEFCVKGNTKATGIKKTMDYLGIDMKYSVAVGDSINDIEMLECAGKAVVMGNAPDEVKQIAEIVTCDAADGGVAEGIYRIIGK